MDLSGVGTATGLHCQQRMDLETELKRLCGAANDDTTRLQQRMEVDPLREWSPMRFGRPSSPIEALTAEIDELEENWRKRKAA